MLSQAVNVLTASYHHHHNRDSCLGIAKRQFWSWPALPDDLAIGIEILKTFEALIAIGCHSSMLNGWFGKSTIWYSSFLESFTSSLSLAIDGEHVRNLEQYREADRGESRTAFNAGNE